MAQSSAATKPASTRAANDDIRRAANDPLDGDDSDTEKTEPRISTNLSTLLRDDADTADVDSAELADVEPPPPLSRFAIRDDGALMVSVEDGDDRNLEGRELIVFVVLTDAERAQARHDIDHALCGAASSAIGRLPKRAL